MARAMDSNGAFSRDALVLGRGLTRFLASHTPTSEEQARLLRASHLLAQEFLAYVAHEIDEQVTSLQQCEIVVVTHEQETLGEHEADEGQTTH